MSAPTSDQMAWAAGFFDGEGCVVTEIRGNGNGIGTWVKITNTNRPALVRFKRIMGGGKIQRLSREAPRRTAWMWQGGVQNHRAALYALLTHLVIKKTELSLLLKLSDERVNVGRRGYTQKVRTQRLQIVRRIRALKRREWK